MPKKITIRGVWEILKCSANGFMDDRIAKLSGALAYYTLFSIAPLLLLIISLCSLFLGKEAIEGEVFATLSGFLGADAAAQIQEIIRNATISDKSTMAATIGVITLLVGATTVFAEIQDSINTIWHIKPQPKKGWLKMLKNRFLSFSIIISLGFILVVSLALSSLIDGFFQYLQERYPDVAVIFFYIVNQLFTLGITTLIFGVVFKVLPDAKIRWKDVLAGPVVTAVLFMIGKFGISLYISKSDVGSTYGAAASLVILLLWAYYSAMILYFGAEFTKAYALRYGSEILPAEYAVTTREVVIEQEGKSVQQAEGIPRTRQNESGGWEIGVE